MKRASWVTPFLFAPFLLTAACDADISGGATGGSGGGQSGGFGGGIGGETSTASTGSPSTTDFTNICTALGCFDEVKLTLVGAMLAYADHLPLTIDACLDGVCFVADVRLGNENENGCLTTPTGTACCMVEDAATGAGCMAIAGQNVQLSMPVSTEGAFEGAMRKWSVHVKDQAGTELFSAEQDVALDLWFPNGGGCQPSCWVGWLEIPITAP